MLSRFILLAAAAQIGKQAGDTAWYDMSQRIDDEALDIDANSVIVLQSAGPQGLLCRAA